MLTAYAWMEHAECRDLPTEWFFPEAGHRPMNAALAACERCPVRTDCLEYALGFDLLPGLFGGKTQRQRQNIIARRQRL